MISKKYECQGCDKLHDDRYMAENCCPPKERWDCGNTKCEIGRRHPDLQEATACEKGNWP